MPTSIETAVLFVARGGPTGLAAANRFADAYIRNAAEHPHELVFLSKGWETGSEFQRLRAIADSCSAVILELPDDGFDWGAYIRAARQLSHRWLCLLNTHSRPLAKSWLRLLVNAAAADGVGMAGASGSWESPRWSRRHRIDVGIIRGVARSIRYAHFLSHFDYFPNVHLRSNGIVVARTVLQEFAARRQFPANKGAALVLESGKSGLSRFVTAMNGALVVVGADGKSYSPQAWQSSKTYRASNQENLIIADNRTDQYLNASIAVRRTLERLAWGT